MKLFFTSMLVLLNLLGFEQIHAQVAKKIVVEHFTNTLCSICASRNPGFYTALNQKPDIIHIAYHPSSPYSDCIFNKQNKIENDERTKFYGLFGGTPTFTVNGVEKFSSQVQNKDVYTPFENQTSPFSITTTLKPKGPDSIAVEVKITTVASHQMGNMYLYVPMAENTVLYDAPNGEDEHFDVFRQSFTGANPIVVSLSTQVGEVYTYRAALKLNDIWEAKRLFALAILQTSTKINGNFEVVQADKSALFNPDILSNVNELLDQGINFSIVPNPASSTITIPQFEQASPTDVLIFNQFGALAMKTVLSNNKEIDISSLNEGVYFLKINNKQYSKYQKFLKLNP